VNYWRCGGARSSSLAMSPELHRQVDRFYAGEDLAAVDTRLAVDISNAGAVGCCTSIAPPCFTSQVRPHHDALPDYESSRYP